MKTKLEMAHEWAMKHGDAKTIGSRQNMIKYAWEYADAMQAEAEKRNKAEAAQKRKEIREMLNDANTFIEREGQHCDDVEEWQPDWSQAPEWAVAFTVDTHGDSMWWSEQPTRTSLSWFVDDYIVWRCDAAPSFGYTGDWRNSLRKRPQ